MLKPRAKRNQLLATTFSDNDSRNAPKRESTIIVSLVSSSRFSLLGKLPGTGLIYHCRLLYRFQKKKTLTSFLLRLVKLTECQAHHPELLSVNPPSLLELELAQLLEAHKSDNERLGKMISS